MLVVVWTGWALAVVLCRYCKEQKADDCCQNGSLHGVLSLILCVLCYKIGGRNRVVPIAKIRFLWLGKPVCEPYFSVLVVSAGWCWSLARRGAYLFSHVSCFFA